MMKWLNKYGGVTVSDLKTFPSAKTDEVEMMEDFEFDSSLELGEPTGSSFLDEISSDEEE